VSCRGRPHLAPQAWQSIEVAVGFTKMTRRPALFQPRGAVEGTR
jgi:hypothetical protein